MLRASPRRGVDSFPIVLEPRLRRLHVAKSSFVRVAEEASNDRRDRAIFIVRHGMRHGQFFVRNAKHQTAFAHLHNAFLTGVLTAVHPSFYDASQ